MTLTPREPKWIFHIPTSHHNDFISHRGVWASMDDRKLELGDPVAFVDVDEVVVGTVKKYGKVKHVPEAQNLSHDMCDWWATVYDGPYDSQNADCTGDVRLTYFKPGGKFYSDAVVQWPRSWSIHRYWELAEFLQTAGRLPGLIGGAGKSFSIHVEAPGHPHDHPRLIVPRRREKERTLTELYRELQDLKRPATAEVLKEMFDLEIEEV